VTVPYFYRMKRPGNELKVGDTIDCLGQLHTITHFEPHNGLTLEGIHFPARVSMAGDDWGITVFDDENYTVLDVQTPHERATCPCDRCGLWRAANKLSQDQWEALDTDTPTVADLAATLLKAGKVL
jgi:hypothetical protein